MRPTKWWDHGDNSDTEWGLKVQSQPGGQKAATLRWSQLVEETTRAPGSTALVTAYFKTSDPRTCTRVDAATMGSGILRAGCLHSHVETFQRNKMILTETNNTDPFLLTHWVSMLLNTPP